MSENIIPNCVISMPSQLFTLARKFQAASNGKIFIGKIDTDPTIPENQIQVYLENEDGTTVPVSQPLIINQAGYPVYNGQIAKFVTVQGHSMAVYDSYGAQQFYYPNVLKYDPDQFEKRLNNKGGDKLVGSSHGGTVYSDYAVCEVRRVASFGGGGSVNSSKDAVFFTDESLWYVSKSTTYPVQVPESPDATWRCIGLLNGYPVYDVRNWGLVGDDFTDNTEAFKVMIAKTSGEHNKLTFPAGIFRYTDIGSVTINRTTWEGAGSLITSLRCMSEKPEHIALNIDAWPDPLNPAQPYLDAFNLNRIHIEGNENTKYVLHVQGLSRSMWEDVTVWGANSSLSSSVGVVLKSVHLSRFSHLMCSKYHNLAGENTNKPTLGMRMTGGSRAGSGQGGPTNNNFISLYMEGMPRGLNMDEGDGNQFIGGSCEANTDYGTNITKDCRFNTFIGMGNENLNATTGDFIDRGYYTKFINCYSSQRFIAGGISGTIDGGFFERLEFQPNSVSYEVKNLTVNKWDTGAGGLYEGGVGHVFYNIYDNDIPDYINTTDIRHAITLTTTSVSGGTQGVWNNTTRLPVTVFIQGDATLTRVRILRGGDAASVGVASAQQLHLEAKDRIELTWITGSSAPVCSYRAKRGYN
ncbi:TPA: phage head-binding domain-containing protein [Morganella morganii]